MPSWIGFFVLLIGVSGALAETQSLTMEKSVNELRKSPFRELQADWKTEMETKSVQDDFTRSDFFWLYVGAEVEYSLGKRVWFDVDARLRMGSESTQSLFEKQDETNGVLLNEARANLKVLESLRVSAGALDQRKLEAPLLIGERAFLGTQQSLTLINGSNWDVLLEARQTIPSSRTFSSENAELEGTPYFFNESVALSARPLKGAEFKGHLTHFTFQDLPGAVAMKSDYLGNTVLPTQGQFSEFRYKYAGIHAAGSWEQRLTAAIKTKVGATYLENFEAPEGLNKGQRVYGAMRVDFQDFALEPRFEHFVNQNDSAPAFYSSEDYGHNNRVGQMYAMGLRLKNYDMNLIGTYVTSQAINRDPLQPDQSYYSIRMEVDL